MFYIQRDYTYNRFGADEHLTIRLYKKAKMEQQNMLIPGIILPFYQIP